MKTIMSTNISDDYSSPTNTIVPETSILFDLATDWSLILSKFEATINKKFQAKIISLNREIQMHKRENDKLSRTLEEIEQVLLRYINQIDKKHCNELRQISTQTMRSNSTFKHASCQTSIEELVISNHVEDVACNTDNIIDQYRYNENNESIKCNRESCKISRGGDICVMVDLAEHDNVKQSTTDFRISEMKSMSTFDDVEMKYAPASDGLVDGLHQHQQQSITIKSTRNRCNNMNCSCHQPVAERRLSPTPTNVDNMHALVDKCPCTLSEADQPSPPSSSSFDEDSRCEHMPNFTCQSINSDTGVDSVSTGYDEEQNANELDRLYEQLEVYQNELRHLRKAYQQYKLLEEENEMLTEENTVLQQFCPTSCQSAQQNQQLKEELHQLRKVLNNSQIKHES
ncbi:hypothetical protein GJ496_009218 [Pomphorhynchus laevis]|nr:hypothetical protein GJ496_009218 [Pomphorhynchus laevis]